MWTDVFGSAAVVVCRAYHSVFGHFPTACLVNAGYPALIAAVAIAVVLLVIASVGWRKLRSKT